jgi:hypothetical protein
MAGRGANTDLEGIVAGIHARWTGGQVGLKATLAYSGGKANTGRTLPVDGAGRGDYDLAG